MLCYPIELTIDENERGERSFLVTCPHLPEITTFGDDEDAASLQATRAIEEAVAARIAENSEIPEPVDSASVPTGTPIAPIALLTALKIALYREMRASQVTRAELCRRLGWKREQVERLFRVDHASRLDQIESAFKALGKTIAIRVERIAA